MAFKIKAKKVNRRYLYTCIKAQQLKIHELFEAIEATKAMRLYLEKRVKELMVQNDTFNNIESIYSPVIANAVAGLKDQP